jgi:hypothetical protein
MQIGAKGIENILPISIIPYYIVLGGKKKLRKYIDLKKKKHLSIPFITHSML